MSTELAVAGGARLVDVAAGWDTAGLEPGFGWWVFGQEEV